MTEKQDIAKRFREFRKQFKLNQTLLADKLSVSQQNISQIESGIIYPSIETLIKITSEYGISADWLLTGKEFEEVQVQGGAGNEKGECEKCREKDKRIIELQAKNIELLEKLMKLQAEKE